MIRLLHLYVVVIATIGVSFAATYPATSPSLAHVQEAYALCADDAGDIITIPAGTAAWTTHWLMSKGITIQGAGIGQTIIYDHVRTGDGHMIKFNSGIPWRMTGISFKQASRAVTGVASTDVFTAIGHFFSVGDPVKFSTIVGGSPIDADSSPATYYVINTPTADTFQISSTLGGSSFDTTTDLTNGTVRLSTSAVTGSVGVFQVSSTPENARVDNCEFVNLDKENFRIYAPRLLIDNCTFLLNHSRVALVARNGTYGDVDWESPATWGTSDAVFLEDNTISRGASPTMYSYFDSIRGGGRLVSRYNQIFKARASYHGTESSGRFRSGRTVEAYKNTLDFNTPSPAVNAGRVIEMRGGNILNWGNNYTGPFNQIVQLTAYRRLQAYWPFGHADGTKLWDVNDISDPGGGPAGGDVTANDGVWETGTATYVAADRLDDSNKSWGLDVWKNYTVRQFINLTAASGGLRSVTVSPSPNWPSGYWAGWEFIRTSDKALSQASSNTADTITLSTNYAAIDMTGGGAFQMSYAGFIGANNSTSLTLQRGNENSRPYYKVGVAYEIRKIDHVMDTSGSGTSAVQADFRPTHQSTGQTISEHSYAWNNISRSSSTGLFVLQTGTAKMNGWFPLQHNRNYFQHADPFNNASGGVGVGTAALKDSYVPTITGTGFWVTDEGEWNSEQAGADGQLYVWNGTAWVLHYTPYTYPHPFRTGVVADTTPPTLVSATVLAAGTTLRAIFSENVTGLNAAHYSTSIGTLSTPTGSLSVWDFPITTITDTDVLTLSYTSGAGRTTDTAGNNLGTFGPVAVTNNSLETTPILPRAPKRGAVKDQRAGR